MSIRVMTSVWDKGKRYEGGALLVLLALADWADDGGRCFPSVPQIAEKSRLTERQVYRVLNDLKMDGVLLKASSSRRGQRTVYQINTDMLSGDNARNPGAKSERSVVTPEKMSGVRVQSTEEISGFAKQETPDICSVEPLTSTSVTPDICDIPPHPPLGVTVIEPSQTVRNLTPTPPRGREGGSVERDSHGPVVATVERRLATAVEMLARICDVSDRRQRRKLLDAIRQYAAKERMGPEEVAAAMVAAWQEYRDAMPMLRFRWGPVKFFVLGYWRNPDGWPWDQQLVARASVSRHACVGMAR